MLIKFGGSFQPFHFLRPHVSEDVLFMQHGARSVFAQMMRKSNCQEKTMKIINLTSAMLN